MLELVKLINTPTRGDNSLNLLATDVLAYVTIINISDEFSGLDHKVIHGSIYIIFYLFNDNLLAKLEYLNNCSKYA